MFEIRFNGSLQRHKFSTLFSVVSRKHVRSHPITDNHASKAGTAHVPIIVRINRWMDRWIARGVNQNGSETTHSRHILPRYVSINPARWSTAIDSDQASFPVKNNGKNQVERKHCYLNWRVVTVNISISTLFRDICVFVDAYVSYVIVGDIGWHRPVPSTSALKMVLGRVRGWHNLWTAIYTRSNSSVLFLRFPFRIDARNSVRKGYPYTRTYTHTHIRRSMVRIFWCTSYFDRELKQNPFILNAK